MSRKQLALKKVLQLNAILKRTKKRRIVYKLINRLSDGTSEYFIAWVKDVEAHKTLDRVNGGIRMPSTIELTQRYGQN